MKTLLTILVLVCLSYADSIPKYYDSYRLLSQVVDKCNKFVTFMHEREYEVVKMDYDFANEQYIKQSVKYMSAEYSYLIYGFTSPERAKLLKLTIYSYDENKIPIRIKESTYLDNGNCNIIFSPKKSTDYIIAVEVEMKQEYAGTAVPYMIVMAHP